MDSVPNILVNDFYMPKTYKGKLSDILDSNGCRKRMWTKDEVEYLKFLKSKGFSNKKIAEYIYRNENQVYLKIKQIRKQDKTYNRKHVFEKYDTNLKFLSDCGIETVLDLYAGCNSFYNDKNMKSVTSNDIDVSFNTTYHLKAFECITILYEIGEKYDLIDLDPYGSAYDCFELAIKMAKKGLIITLGEMSARRFKKISSVNKNYSIEKFEDFTSDFMINHIIKLGELNGKILHPIYIKEWKNITRVYFKIDNIM